MARREATDTALPPIEVTRRQALRGLVGGAGALGAAKAVDNVLIGYGDLVGTNLVAQAESGELATLAGDGLRPRRTVTVRAGTYGLSVNGDSVRAVEDDRRLAQTALAEVDGSWAAEAGLPPSLERLATDIGAVHRGAHTFEFYDVDGFFDRVGAAETRPLVVDALRRWPPTEPGPVATFTDADPADSRAVLTGLVDGFREHTYYDAPRYVAGSIQDNVIFGAADLRAPFREPADFEALTADGSTGLFCYEFTHRSLESLHAVPATEQSVPVMAARVWDRRHKHVYTAVASAVRDGGKLAVPVTFVDYTHTTLYDDAGLRGLLGEGFEAFNERHRASVIHWSPWG
jgi:hypothetical protein